MNMTEMTLTVGPLDIPIPRLSDLAENENRSLIDRSIETAEGSVCWKVLVARNETQLVPRISFSWDTLLSVESVTGSINLSLFHRYPREDDEILENYTVSVNKPRSGKWIPMPSFESPSSEESSSDLKKLHMRLSFSLVTVPEQFGKLSMEQKHDAVLLVEGTEVPVNKHHLSFHSEYFNGMFNSNLKEKTMKEIPIHDVSREHFTALLDLLSPGSHPPTVENVAELLKLAEYFLMPVAFSQCEHFLLNERKMKISDKICLADQYELDKLLKSSIGQLREVSQVHELSMLPSFDELKDATKLKIFHRLLNVIPIKQKNIKFS